MMKTRPTCISIAISMMILISCKKEKDMSDFRMETFFLQDSLIGIQLQVPVELDSFYTWIDSNDTGCGSLRKYRFSDSKYPIVKESGFIKTEFADSTYQLTISHSKYLDCPTHETNLKEVISASRYRAKVDSTEFRLYYADNLQIDGVELKMLSSKIKRPFLKYPSTSIWGSCTINNVTLEIEYECFRKNCAGFIERMDASIRSLKLIKRPEKAKY